MLPSSLLSLLLLPLAASLASASSSTVEEEYTEDLRIRPLPDGKVNAHFRFVTHLNQSDSSKGHHYLSPSPLLALLHAHEAQGFDLALTAGLWDHSRWGYPLGNTGGTGAELWAWMREGELRGRGEDERHEALMQALSGLFCASLGQALTNTFTTRPHIPHLASPSTSTPFHTTSPPSSLCTENLTPFLKLLPSKGRSGLASLLEPHRVFGSHWHSMKVEVSREIGEDERRSGVKTLGGKAGEERLRIEMGFEVVWDMVGRKKDGSDVKDLSLTKIFHRDLASVFPPASRTTVTLDFPRDVEGIDWTVQSDGHEVQLEELTWGERFTGVTRAVWELDASLPKPFDFLLHCRDTTPFVYPLSYPSPPLSFVRTHQGVSQTSGRFLTLIQNTSPHSREAVLMEEWPWWVGPFLSERKLTVGGVERADLLPSQSYTPSIPHVRPSTLLTHLLLPPNTTLSLSLPFLKQFLKYNEHPPDAARGFELTAAVLFPLPLSTAARDDQWKDADLPEKIYSSNLLMDLATPDFSMPYNVIIMSSTLLALFFGSIFNLLTRRIVFVRVDEFEEEIKEVEVDSASGPLKTEEEKVVEAEESNEKVSIPIP